MLHRTLQLNIVPSHIYRQTPKAVIQSSSQVPWMCSDTPFLMACSTFSRKYKICTPPFNRKVCPVSSFASTPRDVTHSHSASLFLWQGQTSTVWLWYSIFFSFFNVCLKELVIVKRKNYYLNLVLIAGAGMQKHRAIASVIFLHTGAFYCTAGCWKFNPKLNHKEIRRA